jgi:hypothetical protein
MSNKTSPLLNKRCYVACASHVPRPKSILCKTTILGGDFRQVLLIIKHENREAFVKTCFKKLYLWQHVEIMCLNINIHVQQLEIEV